MPSKRLTKADFDRIRKEVEEYDQPFEPGQCHCQTLACCKGEGHEARQCPNPTAVKHWRGHEVWLCARCNEYEFGGSKYVERSARA